jgi:NADH-quinone oxidoreductase subunit F
VQIKLNSPVATIDELKEKGYAAVFIGSGAHQAQKLNIDGNGLKGVLSGIDFLREVNLGKKMNIGDDVIVVGGGSTAMDAARMARRLGAKNVRLVYRRTRAEMPALPEELIGAEEEGIEMDFLVNPLKVVGKAGKVSGLHCIRTDLADFDDSGRRRPVPVDGSEFTIRASAVIYCLGQKLSLGLTGGKLNLDKRGHIAVDPRSMATSVPGVFAGGDAVNPSTVIESVAQGRQAAVSIDRFFGRPGALYEQQHQVVEVHYDEEAYLKTIARKEPRLEDAEKRVAEPSLEVSRGLTLDDAVEEARRCLHCDRIQTPEQEAVKSETVAIEAML